MWQNGHLYIKQLCIISVVADNTQNPFTDWADDVLHQKQLTAYK